MSVLRHEKETLFRKKVLEILESKYDNNFHYFKEAEKDVRDYYGLLKKIKNTNNILNNKIIHNYNKHTVVDLKNKTVSLNMSECPESLLAYSLEFLSVKRIFPFSLNHLLEKQKNKDLKNHAHEDEANKVFTWVKDRILNTQFTIGNISLDRDNGVFKYGTTMRDRSYGTVMQYVTAKIPKDKILQISGTDLKSNLLDLSSKYNSLFAYFMMFGFTEFYTRCTCPDYVRKYSKKLGISNYLCPHILYSMAQMPYYMMYVL